MTYVACKDDLLICLISDFTSELADLLQDAWPWEVMNGGQPPDLCFGGAGSSLCWDSVLGKLSWRVGVLATCAK